MRCNSKSAHRLCIVGVQAILIASLCAQETISDAARESLPTKLFPDATARIKIPDAELALSNASHIEALHLMDRTLAIKHASGLVLPEDFEIKYAQTAWAAGQYRLVHDWLAQYLSATSKRTPSLHREALELFAKAKQVLTEWEIARRQIDSAIAERDPLSVDLMQSMLQTLADLDARPGPEILFKLGQIVSMNLLVVETVAQHNGFPNRLLRASDDALEETLEEARYGIRVLEKGLILIRLDQKDQQHLAADVKCLLTYFKYLERDLLGFLERDGELVWLPALCPPSRSD